jgi:hypothetical protein
MIFSSSVVFAQSDNVSSKGSLGVQLGASVTYYYGSGDRNFGDFEDNRVNWQINSMLGFSIAKNASGKRTYLGAFGTYGFTNENMIRQVFKDQGYTTISPNQSTTNNYFLLEGGILIAEKFRVSTGIGQQNFDEQTLISSNGIRTSERLLKFNSTTVGFQFNFSSMAWVINCNIASSKDFNSSVITPSTGLTFAF